MVEPMELGHMLFKKGRTFEDYVGLRGLERLGKRRWRSEVAEVVERLRAALEPEYIVLGGGNAKRLKELPKAFKSVEFGLHRHIGVLCGWEWAIEHKDLMPVYEIELIRDGLKQTIHTSDAKVLGQVMKLYRR